MNSILNRYVVRQLSISTVYALLALSSLYLFFDVMAEMSDVGKGTYNNAKMVQYVLMQVPAHAYELMPLAVLVGGLIAMSQLANHSELTVIKTSGVSVRRIIGMMLQFGTLFAIVTLLLGEWIMPSVGRHAEQFKLNATQNTISAGTKSGIWIKQNHDIINVAEMLPDTSLRHIRIYRMNDAFELIQTIQAEAATVEQGPSEDEPTIWLLQRAQSTQLSAERTLVEQHPILQWPVAVNHQLLNVLLVKPEQMSMAALGTYIAHLQQNQQQTSRYRLAWWRKLTYPLATLIMALVALAFTPQHTRHGNMGLKLFLGICLGLGFHFAGRLFGFTSQLYHIPPLVAATLPTLLFALLAIALIRRQERR